MYMPLRFIAALSFVASTAIGHDARVQEILKLGMSRDTKLALTAVTSEPDRPDARIECWQLLNPFTPYPTLGRAVKPLADLSNITYVVIPPRSTENLHHPPSPMLFVLLSGMAHVTLPYGDDDLWIQEGENQVVIANDMDGVGHNTSYPLDRLTVALQLPFKDGKLPDHTVLHVGACKASDNVN